MSAGPILILGAGQAGVQLADSLRREGFEGEITLIGEDPNPPYQRPPLSKTYLMDTFDAARLPLRPDAFYDAQRVTLMTGVRAERIDRAAKTVSLSDGATLPYDKLALTLGARVRTPPIPGVAQDGVLPLRTLADSEAIKRRLATAKRVAVIGGGFIGLETASAARTLGKAVTIVEALDRLMSRAVGQEISSFFHNLHTERGSTLIYGARVERIAGDRTLHLEGRIEIPADLVILGAGVIPDIAIAEAAGLACSNGILVDEFCRTNDPGIVAAGDCAAHPNALSGRVMRLESVQNAIDQAKIAAKTLTGQTVAYDAVPWFWSDQYDVKLQMAGLSQGHDAAVRRGDPAGTSFSVFYFRAGRLIAVDSVSAPADHMAARRLLAKADPAVTASQAADPGFDLRAAAL